MALERNIWGSTSPEEGIHKEVFFKREKGRRKRDPCEFQGASYHMHPANIMVLLCSCYLEC
jgi:hypothetical protein